jgi:carboxyl-terminal processing protease
VVRTQFVGEYDQDTAADAALSGLVSGLGDRWSYYVNTSGYESLKSVRSNGYVGIGVTVSYTDKRGLLVQSVREDSPAAEGGLMTGDIITAVDGVSLAGEGQSQGTALIQGKAGTAVTLTVLGEDGTEREVTLRRAQLKNSPVTYELLENGVGYVALSNFNTGAGEALNAAVDDLVDQGATALLFDMRNNGGGYVSELTTALDHLLPEGPIFRSQTKSGKEQVTESDEACIDLPMAVLVNGNTYSAAEFFAAQCQESVGALIVGEETCGKGFSQQTIPLLNGGALNISTGRYTTGAGVSLIGTGVTLDGKVEMTEEESKALQAGTLSYEDDPQIQKALELLS